MKKQKRSKGELYSRIFTVEKMPKDQIGMISGHNIVLVRLSLGDIVTGTLTKYGLKNLRISSLSQASIGKQEER